jgi:hypothetical protein
MMVYFYFLVALLKRKINNKILLAFMKTNRKNFLYTTIYPQKEMTALENFHLVTQASKK